MERTNKCNTKGGGEWRVKYLCTRIGISSEYITVLIFVCSEAINLTIPEYKGIEMRFIIVSCLKLDSLNCYVLKTY